MLIYLYYIHSLSLIYAACVAVESFTFIINTKKFTLFATNIEKKENEVRKNVFSRERKGVLQILIVDPESTR